MDPRDAPPRRRHRLRAALILGSPCLAAAMTFGVAYADLYLITSLDPWSKGGGEVVGLFNGLLASLGAAAGGLLAPGTALRRLAAAALAGVFGGAAYLAILLALNDLLPPI